MLRSTYLTKTNDPRLVLAQSSNEPSGIASHNNFEKSTSDPVLTE